MYVAEAGRKFGYCIMGTGKIRNAEFKAISMGKLNNDIIRGLLNIMRGKSKFGKHKGGILISRPNYLFEDNRSFVYFPLILTLNRSYLKYWMSKEASY